MYLAEVRIKNFRKIGECDNGDSGLVLQLKAGLNVLIGENDSGKTCVIDAIRFLLLTQSREYLRLEREDFHDEATELKIECVFKGISVNQAKDFLEWLGIDEYKQYFLKVFLSARKDTNDKITVDDVRAGADIEGQILHSKARDLLRAIYLKPLRDAENELSAKKNSRFSQILNSHPEFSKGNEHELVEILRKANDDIKKYFDYEGKPNEEKQILKSLDHYLSKFSDDKKLLKSNIEITKTSLKTIFEKIDLVLNNTKPGLGSLNQLYIAAELLLLQTEKSEGANLTLIEEIEAHLHPQAQLRVIEYLQEICDDQKSDLQILLTTHSVTLASSIKLENLIVFTEGTAFSLACGNTKLHEGDYKFLERFLDSTKANLFFAKGVLVVEGDAENLLLPALAEIIGKKLSKCGVSIVNVGSTALLRYAKILSRKQEPKMILPVAIITDCDVKVYKKDGTRLVVNLTDNIETVKTKRKDKIAKYTDDNIRGFVSPQWTLEFDIACSCLRTELYAAILMAEDYEREDRRLGHDKTPVAIRESQDYLIEAKTAIAKWIKEDEFEIAKNISERIVLKSNSKVVAAQCFAKILLNKKFTSEDIENIKIDKYLNYLVNAIHYATRG